MDVKAVLRIAGWDTLSKDSAQNNSVENPSANMWHLRVNSGIG